MKFDCRNFTFGIAVTLLFGCLTFVVHKFYFNNIPNKCPLMINELYNVTLDNEIIHSMDNTYYAIKKNDMKDILEMDKTDRNSYKKESFDCDEFGFVLMANIMKLGKQCKYKYRLAFGIITGFNSKTSKRHLMNFFIDDTYTFWCIEPQKDSLTLCNNTGLTFKKWAI